MDRDPHQRQQRPRQDLRSQGQPQPERPQQRHPQQLQPASFRPPHAAPIIVGPPQVIQMPQPHNVRKTLLARYRLRMQQQQQQQQQRMQHPQPTTSRHAPPHLPLQLQAHHAPHPFPPTSHAPLHPPVSLHVQPRPLPLQPLPLALRPAPPVPHPPISLPGGVMIPMAVPRPQVVVPVVPLPQHPMPQQPETSSSEDEQHEEPQPGPSSGRRRKRIRKDEADLVETCHVCGERAKKHKHYGAISCFSCKAFFRRAVQDNKMDFFECRGNNNCPVSKDIRKHCQKCRYAKCIKAGMNRDWVLSNAQRQRRYVHRQEQEAQANLGTDAEDEDAEMGSSAGSESSSTKESNRAAMEELLSKAWLKTTINFVPKKKLLERDGATTYIYKVSHDYDKMFKSISLGASLMKEMIFAQRFGFPLSAEATLCSYNIMIHRMVAIAKPLPEFAALSAKAQRGLFRRNLDLMVLVHGAVYFEGRTDPERQFTSSLGEDDLETAEVLMRKVSADIMNQPNISLRKIDYHNFNRLQRFDETEEEIHFNETLAQVGAILVHNVHLLRFFSLLLLFGVNDNDDEEATHKISNSDKDIIGMVRNHFTAILERGLKYGLEKEENSDATTPEVVFQSLMASIVGLRDMKRIHHSREFSDEAQAAIQKIGFHSASVYPRAEK